MTDFKDKNDIITDSLLENEGGYLVEAELGTKEYPEYFTKIHDKIIKSVSLYLQLLWSANPNGKTVGIWDVSSILKNVKNLFGTRYETKDIYVIRHIASDLREISLFNGFDMKKYFKNINIERLDIKKRLELSVLVTSYFSTIVHFNYTSGDDSYEKVKNINKKLTSIGISIIKVPDDKQDYLEKQTFEDIFEKISIIFIMNYYEIFSEFLFNDVG